MQGQAGSGQRLAWLSNGGSGMGCAEERKKEKKAIFAHRKLNVNLNSEYT